MMSYFPSSGARKEAIKSQPQQSDSGSHPQEEANVKDHGADVSQGVLISGGEWSLGRQRPAQGPVRRKESENSNVVAMVSSSRNEQRSHIGWSPRCKDKVRGVAFSEEFWLFLPQWRMLSRPCVRIHWRPSENSTEVWGTGPQATEGQPPRNRDPSRYHG